MSSQAKVRREVENGQNEGERGRGEVKREREGGEWGEWSGNTGLV